MTGAALALDGIGLSVAGCRPHLLAKRSRVPVLEGITLAIPEGEALALTGRSGAGKSTLARVAAGLVAPDRGSVRIGGRPMTGSRADRAAVQMVLQDPGGSLPPGLTARAVLDETRRNLCPDTEDAALVRACMAARFDPGLMDRPAHSLSTGQQARLNLARALVPRPRVLILDEPTAALDSVLQAAVLKALAALRDGGAAILLVTHDLHVARLLCDRTAVMDGGRLVEEGPTDAILARPRTPAAQALVAAMPVPRSGR
ncbi:MAG: ABC transporter ATP-binding protein [Gemmobacter sp.]